MVSETVNKTLHEKQVKSLTCTYCRLHEGRTQVVPGHGNPESKIFFVAEAPGKDEDLEGIPLCGKAGKLFNLLLQDIGLRREDIYVNNTVLCRPPENRTPYEDERQMCFQIHAASEIMYMRPKIVVAMGSSAIKACEIPFKTVKEVRGQIFECVMPKICSWHTAIIPTYHPAALLPSRNPDLIPLFLEDLQKAKEYRGLV